MKLLERGLLKKVVSVLVAICLIVGVANVPVYAVVTNVSTSKTTDAVLSKPYTTPAEAAKLAATASVSDDTINKKYGKKGVNLINEFSTKYNVDKTVIYNIFVKNNVTKDEMDFIGDYVLDALKSETGCFISTWAYESINKTLNEIKQLVGYTAEQEKEDRDKFFTNHFYKLTTDIIKNLLSKVSGLAKSWLKAAQKIVDEIKNSSKSFYEKYQLLSKAHSSINNVSKNNASIESLEKESGTNSVFSSLQSSVLNKSNEYKVYKNAKDIKTAINGLLAAEGTSELAKTWLKAAQKIVNGIQNGDQTDAEKVTALTKALKSIQNISNKNATIASLEKESGTSSVFSNLQASVLNKSNEYKIYKNAKDIKTAINSLLAAEGTSELAKTWLKAAQKVVNNIQNGDQTDADKVTALTKALKSIQNIVNKNATIASLEKESASSSVFSGLQASVLNKSNEYKVYKNAKDIKTLINSISSAEGTSELAKTWLKAAQKVVNGIQNGDQTDAEKVTALTKALKSIKNISNSKATIESLEKESGTSSVFSSLQSSVLNKSNEYKVYKNAKDIKTAINGLLAAEGTGTLAKKWLNAAQTVVDGITNGDQTDAEKVAALTKALKSIKNISNSKATIESLEKESGTSSVFSGLQASVLNKSNEYKVYKNAKDIKTLINGMLSKEGTSELAKTWLKAAQGVVDGIENGSKSYAQKATLLASALKSIQNISSNNASTAILEQESGKDSVFSELQSIVLNKEVISKNIKTLINGIISKSGTSALAKTWLKAAQKVVNNILNGTQTDEEKTTLLAKALKSIQNISDSNATIASLDKESISTSVFSSLKSSVLNKSDEYKVYKNAKDIKSQINSLLKKEGTSELAKTWLNAAQEVVDGIVNGGQTDAEKATLLASALKSIKNISSANASIESLEKESGTSSVFSSLKSSVLNKSNEYKVYKNAKDIKTLINNLSSASGISALAKTWLKAAQGVVDGIVNGTKTDAQKATLLTKALKSIKNVSNNKASIEVLEQESISTGVFSSLQASVLDKSNEYKIYKNAKDIKTAINGLLAAEGTSELAKTWLNAAQKVVDGIVNGDQTDAEKIETLTKALKSIQNISNSNATIASLDKESISTSVFSSLKSSVLNKSNEYKVYKNAKDIKSQINSLLKKEGTSELAKTWLNAAQKVVDGIQNGTQTDAEKATLLASALKSIKNVSSNNASIESLEKESGTSSVFSSLKSSVLNKSNEYKVYKNEKDIKTLINSLVSKEGTSELAKTWLNAAQEVVDGIVNGDQTDADKVTALTKALKSIKNISSANASIASLEKESGTSSVFSSLKSSVLNKSNEYKIYKNEKDIKTLISSLVSKEETSELAKSWLNAAQTVVDGIVNGTKTDAQKVSSLTKALKSIKNVSSNNCSIAVLEQESASGSVFSSLQKKILDKSAEYQDYKNDVIYAEQADTVKSLIAEKFGLDKSVVSQQFSAAGVTNKQLAEASGTITEKINGGTNFVNHSAIALSKVLNVDKNLVAVQQLAVAVAKGSNISAESSLENQLEVFKMNGKTGTAIYTESTLDDVISSLKVGEGIVLNVISGVSFVSVVKKSDNSFIVTDKDFTQNGTIVDCEYTADELKKLMNYENAKFTFTLNGLRYSGSRTYWYEPANSEGKIKFVSCSSGIKEGEDAKLNTQYVQPMIKSINTLLNKAGTSSLAKTWLNKAKEIINGIISSDNSVVNEEEQLKQLEKSIERVVSQNASIAVLLQETSTNKLLNGLQSQVLNKDANVKNVIYPIFNQNVKEAVATINDLLSNGDLGEVEQAVLNGAYNLITNTLNEIVTIVNSGSSNYTTQQQTLQKAAASINRIKEANVSLTVLDQETQKGTVFASLRKTLENTETFQVYQVYGDLGATAIRSFANYLNVLESVVFQQFVRFNVTAEQLQNVGNTLINLIQNKANFFNCASLAVAKYLGIDRTSAVIQNLAGDISLGHGLGTDGMNTGATNNDSMEKVLQINGVENATLCAVSSLDDLMNGLKVGEKAILAVYCYGLGGHAVTVKREANGWGVFDTNRNGGEEVIYTPENFVTLMTGANNTTVQGTTSDGKTYSNKVYYNAITSYQHSTIERTESGGWAVSTTWPDGIKMITDAEGILAIRDTHAILK